MGRRLAVLLFVLAMLETAGAAGDSATTRMATTTSDAPTTQALVSQSQMNLYPLYFVSEKHGLAMFVHLNPQSQTHAVCSIDLKTGQVSDLSESFGDKPRPTSVPQLTLSPDGGRCLVAIDAERGRALYVLDLTTQKASKLAVPSSASGPLWCGASKLVWNEREQHGLPNRAKLIDVQTGKLSELPFFGRVLAVDMLGTTFVALANRDDPKQPDAGMRPLCIMAVTDEGKVLKAFPDLRERDLPVLSPRGKHLAYWQGGDEDNPRGRKCTITALDKDATWQFDAVPEEWIRKVSDAGEVITAKEAGVGERGTTIRYRSSSQPAQVLGGLWNPIVRGNVLYCLGGDSRSIARMSLPLAAADPDESEFRRARAVATAPATQSRPAGRPSGPVHGDFKGTAEEFLAEALKDPDVGIMNPPADKDLYRSLGAKEWIERIDRTAAQLWLYPDATVAEFNSDLRYGQRDANWAGMGASAVGWHRGWYPDGKVMFVEHFTEKGLVWARYYDASEKLLSKIDDGNGTALRMLTKRRPGLVRGELQYANGQPANPEGKFDESKYQTVTTRDSGSRVSALSVSWSYARGLAAYALGASEAPPASSAASVPASLPLKPAWNEDGIGRIWRDGQRACGMRVKDGALFFSDDGGATRREFKFDLGCPPRGLHLAADGSIYIWGNDTTGHPEKGIPNRIVFSRDLGKTWTKTAAPVDYLTSLDVQDDGTITVQGRYVPDGGLREGEHWFLLQPWAVLTTRGERWTKFPAPFVGPPRLVNRIPVGDKGGMIYVVQDPGFRDPGGYSVLLSRGLDEMPIAAAHDAVEPEVVLAKDGQSFQVMVNGKLISTADVRTGQVTQNRP